MIRKISYSRNASDKPSFIYFDDNEKLSSITERHSIFAGIAQLLTASKIKDELEKRVSKIGGLITIEHKETIRRYVLAPKKEMIKQNNNNWFIVSSNCYYEI